MSWVKQIYENKNMHTQRDVSWRREGDVMCLEGCPGRLEKISIGRRNTGPVLPWKINLMVD